MAAGLHERCWRAWWHSLTSAEQERWRTSAQRPFLSREQARELRAEGLPLTTIAGEDPATARVLMPLGLAELLDHEEEGVEPSGPPPRSAASGP